MAMRFATLALVAVFLPACTSIAQEAAPATQKTVTLPAWRLMREIKSQREMPPTTWIFAGSRVLDNGVYAADQTGYLISIVNFDLTVVDTPRLASNANETLEWKTNLDVMPATGTKVTLLIEPAGKIEANELAGLAAAATRR